MPSTIQDILQTTFGYSAFRPPQEEIIENVMAGNDTVVLMPTGGGKSLCYQVPALAMEGLTLVISPLIALMKDQVDALHANGISAAFINSSLSEEDLKATVAKLRAGEIKLLYIAPERFAVPDFQELLKTLPVGLIAIDEAHCISEWGHEFRPDYRNLGGLRDRLFPDTPIIALTATATARVRDDIVKQLRMREPRIFQSSFNRPNLFYNVRPKGGAREYLAQYLKKYSDDSVIIYCLSRKDTENLAAYLRKSGYKAKAYHAGLEREERQGIQEKFQKDAVQVIVATIAFGMGIDKPNVRLVVHYHVPKSVEGYYQETGRAGRDGLPSECLLFYSEADLRNLQYFINNIEEEAEKAVAVKKLAQIQDYCELTECRRGYLLGYFDETWSAEKCDGCDICTTETKMVDVTELAQKILSAVIKTGERFGRTHVLDVLRGAKKERILQLEHDKLSVYGIAKNENKDMLKHVCKQLVTKGYLEQVTLDSGFAILRVTGEGKRFLKERQSLSLKEPSFFSQKPAKTRYEKYIMPNADLELFDKLKAMRKALADERGVPAFVIFGDKTLLEVAAVKPQTLDAFSRISGVGATKLEQFGELFTGAVRDYVTS